MRRLSTLMPGMRWVPHDIERPSSTKKEKDRPRRSILSRKSGAAEPNHGTFKRRQSAISMTNVVDEALDARTHMQGQSLFFTMLPIEIRKMVYEYVFGEETVHLLFARKRFGHFICERGDTDGECGCTVMVGGGKSRRLSSACVRMLTVCRRMYIEGAPHLYTPHTFSLLHITHLLYLPTTLPPARLSTIRILRLKWTIRGMPYFRRSASSKRPAYPEDTANWEKGWGIMARMKSLRDLRVTIVDPSKDGIWEAHWLQGEDLLMRSIRGVKEVRNFVMVLPYQSCRVDRDMGECNVRLVRPVEDGEEGGEE